MIKATIVRDGHSREIKKVTLLGHALFADYGKDIVCAAVSAVTITLINAVEALIGVTLSVQQDEGKLVCDVPELQSSQKTEQVRLLMETLAFSLKSIAKEYPSSIFVIEKGASVSPPYNRES